MVSVYINCGPGADTSCSNFVQLVLGDPEGIGHILQKKIYDYRIQCFFYHVVSLTTVSIFQTIASLCDRELLVFSERD